MIFTDLFENTDQPSRIKFQGTDHDIGEERYVFTIDGNPEVFIFQSDEDNPDPDSPSFEEIMARVQRDGAVEHRRITPAEQQAIAKKIAAERQRYLDQRRNDVSEAMKPSDIPPSMRDRLTMRDIEAERPKGAFRFRVTFPDGHANDYMTFDAAQAAAERAKGRITRLSETQKKTAHRGARGTNPRLERILKMLRATHPTAQNDLEALILDFRGQQAQDRTDIARLDAENDMEEADIDRLEQLVAQLKQRRAMATESLRDREYHVATVTLDDGTTKKVRIATDEGFRDKIRRHFEKQGHRVTDIDVDYSVRSELDEAKKKPQPTNPELWSRAKSAARSKFDVWPSAYASAWAAKYYKSKGGGWRMGKAKKKD